MLRITATELKTNLGKYLDYAAYEDIQINKNGKPIAMLVFPKKQDSWVDKIIETSTASDIMHIHDDVKDIKTERLWEKFAM